MGIFFSRILPSLNIGHKNYIFNLNPGLFNRKEHTLIVIISSTALEMSYGMIFIITKRLFYKREMLDWVPSILILISSKLIGVGLSGIMRKLLVDPANMWYPENLVYANLLLTFHGNWNSSHLQITNDRMLWGKVLFLFALFYQFLPGFFMTSLQSISLLCLITGSANSSELMAPPSTPKISFLAHIGSGLGMFLLTL
jgi:hypothetical protein